MFFNSQLLKYTNCSVKSETGIEVGGGRAIGRQTEGVKDALLTYFGGGKEKGRKE